MGSGKVMRLTWTMGRVQGLCHRKETRLIMGIEMVPDHIWAPQWCPNMSIWAPERCPGAYWQSKGARGHMGYGLVPVTYGHWKVAWEHIGTKIESRKIWTPEW